ncbi:hypothetical protein V5O48_014243 [Marasmius crinis-equi]|uniref:Uncharacterized protein n=1 Tax=Marasmius crinis-equi TaxID=585013 RepID=A0ABR3EXV0_9AGAR
MSSEFSSQESLSSSSTLGVSEYFKNSRHFSIGDNGNFSTVHGDQIQQNYYNTELKKRKFIVGSEEEEAEYEQFPEIRRSEFTAIRNIHRSYEWLYDQEQGSVQLGERRVVAGDVRIGGVASKCLVVQYSGHEAGVLWKKDFRKFGGFRCPENAQLAAINLSNIPMLILTGDLVPAAHLVDRVGVIGQAYLRTLAMQMGCRWDNSLWMDTSRGVFCRGPEGPQHYIMNGFGFDDLPLDAGLVKEDILLRYLTSRKQDREVVQALSLDWDLRTPQSKVERPTVISTLTDTILAVGPSGVWKKEEFKESCLGEREELPNGVTRFTLHHNGQSLELKLDWHEPMCEWLAQATSIFCAHGISLEDNLRAYTNMASELLLPQMLTGTLSNSRAKRQRHKNCPPIYLFIPPLSTSIFWSFDPDGQNPIATDLCHYLGLPISLVLECTEDSWPTSTYKALLTYQIARGFDPNTTEFARHNRYPIYEIAEQPLPSRFEQVEDSKPTEMSLCSVPPEEFDDMYLGVMFGDIQPEDLATNTATQGSALQEGIICSSNYHQCKPTATFPDLADFMGVSDTAHIEWILPEDLKRASPSEPEDAILREASVWSRFIPTFSWAAFEDSDIQSAGF